MVEICTTTSFLSQNIGEPKILPPLVQTLGGNVLPESRSLI